MIVCRWSLLLHYRSPVVERHFGKESWPADSAQTRCRPSCKTNGANGSALPVLEWRGGLLLRRASG